MAWREPWLLGYLAVLGLVTLGGLGLFIRGLGQRLYPLWLPLMVAGCNLVVLTFSSYGRLLGNTDQRYFLPIYLCLPFAWAWLAQSLAGPKGKRVWPGLLLVAALAGLHVSYYSTNVYCASEMCCTGGGYHAHQEPEVRRFMELMRKRGWHYAYSPDSLIRSFVSGDDPVFANPLEERRASAATRVDAAFDPVYVMDIRPNLDLLGLPYESCPDKKCLWEVFHSVGRPAAHRPGPGQRLEGIQPGGPRSGRPFWATMTWARGLLPADRQGTTRAFCWIWAPKWRSRALALLP